MLLIDEAMPVVRLVSGQARFSVQLAGPDFGRGYTAPLNWQINAASRQLAQATEHSPKGAVFHQLVAAFRPSREY